MRFIDTGSLWDRILIISLNGNMYHLYEDAIDVDKSIDINNKLKSSKDKNIVGDLTAI